MENADCGKELLPFRITSEAIPADLCRFIAIIEILLAELKGRPSRVDFISSFGKLKSFRDRLLDYGLVMDGRGVPHGVQGGPGITPLPPRIKL